MFCRCAAPVIFHYTRKQFIVDEPECFSFFFVLGRDVTKQGNVMNEECLCPHLPSYFPPPTNPTDEMFRLHHEHDSQSQETPPFRCISGRHKLTFVYLFWQKHAFKLSLFFVILPTSTPVPTCFAIYFLPLNDDNDHSPSLSTFIDSFVKNERSPAFHDGS